jgi:hypothetical protein
LITNADCTSRKWTCDHRNRGIVAMVNWHNYVGNAKRSNFYTDDANVIAFSKDAKGWAAFNNGTEAKEIRVQPDGPQAHTATSSTTRIPARPAMVRRSWSPVVDLQLSLSQPRTRWLSVAPTESRM